VTTALGQVTDQRPVSDLLAAPGTRVVLLGASRDDNAKVTLLVTPPGATRPQLAVKTATTQAAANAVLAEADVLAQLQQLPLLHLRSTIPRVRELAHTGGLPALVCEVLPGRPMSVAYHSFRHTARRRPVTHDLRAVADWLAALQTLTAGPSAAVEWPAELYDRLRQRHAGAPSLAAASEVLARAAERLAPARTPRVVVHGDLWAGNVLVHGGKVSGVVDWEAATAAGEPLRDLARLVLSYALYLDRHTRPGHRVRGHRGLRADAWGCGMAHVLNGTGWFPDLTRSVLADGLRRLGLDPSLWREVALTGIAEVAVTADESAFARHHLDLLASQDAGRARDSGGGRP